jgi:hypothetical protein
LRPIASSSGATSSFEAVRRASRPSPEASWAAASVEAAEVMRVVAWLAVTASDMLVVDAWMGIGRCRAEVLDGYSMEMV